MSDLSQNKRPGVITLKTVTNCQAIESNQLLCGGPQKRFVFRLIMSVSQLDA
jgi:hypothetical protein